MRIYFLAVRSRDSEPRDAIAQPRAHPQLNNNDDDDDADVADVADNNRFGDPAAAGGSAG